MILNSAQVKFVDPWENMTILWQYSVLEIETKANKILT